MVCGHSTLCLSMHHVMGYLTEGDRQRERQEIDRERDREMETDKTEIEREAETERSTENTGGSYWNRGQGQAQVQGNFVARGEPEPEHQICCVTLGKSLAPSENRFTDT